MHNDDLKRFLRDVIREELCQVLPALLHESKNPPPISQPLPERKQLTAKELIEAYGISKRTLINWQHDGLKLYRVGNKKFYKIEDVERFVLNRNNEY